MHVTASKRESSNGRRPAAPICSNRDAGQCGARPLDRDPRRVGAGHARAGALPAPPATRPSPQPTSSTLAPGAAATSRANRRASSSTGMAGRNRSPDVFQTASVEV